jgi:hypothetical protein
MRSFRTTRVLYTFLSALVIIVGSFVAIRFAQGYRFSLNQKKAMVHGTGLLVANSFPSGAEIYVDDKLVGATDDTIYLEPNTYKVEIKKDGYTPWMKKLKIEAELVTQTNSQLYRVVPSLTPLTFSGITNVSPSPDGQKLLFYTASASAKTKNGLYLLELSNNFFSAAKEPRQIADEAPNFDLNAANFIWSPDNSEVILSTIGHEVLLDLSKKNSLNALPDIGLKKKQTLSEWEATMYLRERQYFDKFPDEIIKIATQSAKNVYLSPDKKKVLYTATASAVLSDNLVPPLVAKDSQPETRIIQPGKTYIYDREEDKNFQLSLEQKPLSSGSATPSASLTGKIFLANDLFNSQPRTLEASPSSFQHLQASSSAQTAQNFASYYSSLYSQGLQWFPDSKHVLFSDQDKIYLLEYDNTNLTTLYSGPFSNNFVYPWPDGSRLLILTSFSGGGNAPANLYGIDLK